MSILHGTIHSVVANKGFGFIQPRDGGPDVFFHCSAVDAAFDVLEPGLEVEYNLDESHERPRASSLRPLNDDTAKRSLPVKFVRRAYQAKSFMRMNDDQEFGFVTKIWRHQFLGFISSVKHGPELMFEAANVTGEKRFSSFKVGEYVRFVRGETPDDPQNPIATSVVAIEREIRTPKLNLPKHRRARSKKPSWR